MTTYNVLIGVIALIKADSPEAAEQLIRFLLQEEAQRYFSDQTFEYPLAAGVAASEVLPEVELGGSGDIRLDELGGDLQSTREMIRDAGLLG